MSKINIQIKFFGAFRKLGEDISIEIPSGSSVLQTKDALVQKLGEVHKNLIESSVLANETDILRDSYVFEEGQNLSILPPVCGG